MRGPGQFHSIESSFHCICWLKKTGGEKVSLLISWVAKLLRASEIDQTKSIFLSRTLFT